MSGRGEERWSIRASWLLIASLNFGAWTAIGQLVERFAS
jgi:hypothetical protein